MSTARPAVPGRTARPGTATATECTRGLTCNECTPDAHSGCTELPRRALGPTEEVHPHPATAPAIVRPRPGQMPGHSAAIVSVSLSARVAGPVAVHRSGQNVHRAPQAVHRPLSARRADTPAEAPGSGRAARQARAGSGHDPIRAVPRAGSRSARIQPSRAPEPSRTGPDLLLSLDVRGIRTVQAAAGIVQSPPDATAPGARVLEEFSDPTVQPSKPSIRACDQQQSLGGRDCPTVQGSSPTVREVRAWTVAPDPWTVGIPRPPKQNRTSNPGYRRFGRLDGWIRELLKDAQDAPRRAPGRSGHAPTPRAARTQSADGSARARTMPPHRPSTASRRSGMPSGRCGRLDGRSELLGYTIQGYPSAARPVEVVGSDRGTGSFPCPPRLPASLARSALTACQGGREARGADPHRPPKTTPPTRAHRLPPCRAGPRKPATDRPHPRYR